MYAFRGSAKPFLLRVSIAFPKDPTPGKIITCQCHAMIVCILALHTRTSKCSVGSSNRSSELRVSSSFFGILSRSSWVGEEEEGEKGYFPGELYAIDVPHETTVITPHAYSSTLWRSVMDTIFGRLLGLTGN